MDRRNASESIRNHERIKAKVRRLATLSLYVGSACFASATGTVTLAWDPNPDPATAGYILYYGASGGAYTNSIDVRHNTTNTVSGLIDGVTYAFVVTAYNLAGLESDFSAELRYKHSSNNNPTLASIPNLTINEDAGPQTVSLQGITSGASNEIQTLTVTAESTNPKIVSPPIVTYNSPNRTGALTFAPLPNANGVTTITVTVNDGQLQRNLFSQSFVVTVLGVNDPPSISAIPNQTITKFSTTPDIPFTINDLEMPAGILTVSATSSNPVLVPQSQIILGGGTSNRTIKVSPALGLTGAANITVSVTDGAATVSRAFLLSVNDNTRIFSASFVRPSGLTLRWASVTGLKYRIAYKDHLNDPTWIDLSTDITANGLISSWTDSTAVNAPSRFYRVRPLQ